MPEFEPFETVSVRPKKANVTVELGAPAGTSYRQAAGGAAQPAWE
jgi:hypothetical protein